MPNCPTCGYKDTSQWDTFGHCSDDFHNQKEEEITPGWYWTYDDLRKELVPRKITMILGELSMRIFQNQLPMQISNLGGRMIRILERIPEPEVPKR